MSVLARIVLARPAAIVIAALIAVLASGVAGAGVTERLSTGGNVVPGSESELAAEALASGGFSGPANLLVLIGGDGPLDAAAADVAAAAASQLSMIDGVVVTGSAWSAGEPGGPLVADDGTSGLVVAHIEGDDAEVQATASAAVEQLRATVVDLNPEVTVQLGGVGPTRLDLIETTDRDLLRAELLALPLCVLLLLWVFRTPVAAVLPLVVAVVAIVGTLVVLRALVAVTEVSIFARSVTTVLGLAMAIDMTLFLVDRYREHRPTTPDAATAVGQAVVKAGPSILFSGLTTATSLAALLAFSNPLLRSFAYAGSVVVLLALVGGLVVLPATMVLLGDRIDRWPVRRADPEGVPVTAGGWCRLAKSVMGRPWVVGLGATVVLLVLAAPLLRLEPGVNDDRAMAPSIESRQVADTIRTDFSGLEGGQIVVIVDPDASADLAPSDLAAYQDALASIEGVARVEDRPEGFAVVPSVEPISSEGRQLVADIRALDAPVPVLVGGEAARLTDNVEHIGRRLPWVIGLTMAAMAALLAVAFRSVLVPLKALVLNLLSLSAMFGAIVWVFQDGRFADLLGYTPTGHTDTAVPALMFAVAFGLSMDYEVYLLARIRESYLASGDPKEAVAVGLQRTGRILTASALLMAIVFGAFVTTSVTHIKVLGLGIALAVLVDAFVVRALLVPAFLAIAGSANWWPGTVDRSPSTNPPPAGSAVDVTDGPTREVFDQVGA